MASPGPEIDPQSSLRRAVDSLRVAVEKQTAHEESLKDERLKGYIVGQQLANEPGTTGALPGSEYIKRASQTQGPNPEQLQKAGTISTSASQSSTIPPSWTTQATNLGQPNTREAGALGPNASTPEEGGTFGGPSPSERERLFRRSLGMKPKLPKGALKGLAERFGSNEGESLQQREEELEEIRREPMTIPQYQWRLDEQLRAARDLAIKGAANAGNPERKTPEMLEGPLASIAKLTNSAYQNAAVIEAGLNPLKKAGSFITQQAFQGEELGRQLGYNPQSGVGGAYVLGFRNPLAALTSEAGQQGLGQKVGALSAMFGGGISLQQSEGLRNALSGEGFSNQGGGIFNAFGENENLAEALEPSVKEGLNPELAARFGNVTRYGNTSIRDLRTSLEGLGTTAKTLKMGIDETAESMQNWIKEMEGKGALPGQAMKAFTGIAHETGIIPTKIAEIGETALGKAVGVGMGIFPGTAGSESSGVQTTLALQTVKRAASMFPGHTSTIRLADGSVEEVSAEQNKLKMAAQVLGINPQMMEDLLKNSGKITAAQKALSGLTNTNEIFAGQHAAATKYYEERHPENAKLSASINKEEGDIREKSNKLNEFISRGETSQAERIEKEIFHKESNVENLRTQQEKTLSNLHAYVKHIELNPHEMRHEIGMKRKEIEGAGVSSERWSELWEQFRNKPPQLAKELEKEVTEAQRIAQGESEGKAMIELSSEAKRFFKLKFPNVAKETANAGGTSTAQNASAPNQGNNPSRTALERLINRDTQNATQFQEHSASTR